MPTYRETVLRHEAGHFLLAYLLGVPVQACVLNPVLASFDRRFDGGRAGTVFLSPAIEALRAGHYSLYMQAHDSVLISPVHCQPHHIQVAK